MADVVRLDKAKKPKVPKRINNTKRADTLFSLIVRAPGRCVIADCGKTDYLECCHIFSRRYRPVRWDERNAVVMCRGHHLFFTVRPLEWDVWSRDWLGAELYEELRTRALAGGRTDFPATLARLLERKREVYS